MANIITKSIQHMLVLVVLLPLILLNPVSTPPAAAESCKIDDFACYLTQTASYLGLDDVINYYSEISDYLTGTAIPGAITAIQDVMNAAITAATPALDTGIPDPIAVGDAVNSETLTPEQRDPNYPNDALRKNRDIRQFNRSMTRSAISAVMNAEGQQNTRSEIDDTVEMMAETDSYAYDPSQDDLYDAAIESASYSTLATDAQNRVVALATEASNALDTQDVLKKIALQNSDMSKQFEVISKQSEILSQQLFYIGEQNSYEAFILGAMRIDNLYARQDAQWTNLNLADISQLLEEQNGLLRAQKLNAGLNIAVVSLFAEPGITQDVPTQTTSASVTP